jgi:hypothetical protein
MIREGAELVKEASDYMDIEIPQEFITCRSVFGFFLWWGRIVQGIVVIINICSVNNRVTKVTKNRLRLT